MKRFALALVVGVSLFVSFAASAFAQAPATRFSLSCSGSPPGDCVRFQDYWDHTNLSNWYDCAFPAQAKQCWPPNGYILKGCKQSPQSLDFIHAHDVTSALFRRAYKNGDFNAAPNLVHVWEHLNATLMHILYPIDNQKVIKADLAKLNLSDAIAFGTIAARYTSDFNDLLKTLSPIAINLLACTDIEKQIPNFVKAALSKVMLIGGVWFVETPQNEPTGEALVYEGSVDLHLSIIRDDCAGPASRPSVLVYGQTASGHSFSTQVSVGGPAVNVVGSSISVRLIKAPKDWTRYQCASGRLTIK
jgi:hypothetical protein